jgi:hypothetical protein
MLGKLKFPSMRVAQLALTTVNKCQCIGRSITIVCCSSLKTQPLWYPRSERVDHYDIAELFLLLRKTFFLLWTAANGLPKAMQKSYLSYINCRLLSRQMEYQNLHTHLRIQNSRENISNALLLEPNDWKWILKDLHYIRTYFFCTICGSLSHVYNILSRGRECFEATVDTAMHNFAAFHSAPPTAQAQHLSSWNAVCIEQIGPRSAWKIARQNITLISSRLRILFDEKIKNDAAVLLVVHSESIIKRKRIEQEEKCARLARCYRDHKPRI